MDYYNNRKKLKGWVIFLIIAAVAAAFFFYKSGTRRAVEWIDDPVQTEVTEPDGTIIKIDGFTLNVNFMYEYDIEALVVHTKDYFGFSVDDKISPKDLALAWGSVAEYNTFVDFHWKQNGRWYYFSVDSQNDLDKVGGVTGIYQHSSNNHIIPANDDIRNKVFWIRRGDHIRLKGYLVSISGTGKDGTTFSWNSSTTRNDRGDHACEVFYVTDVEWI